MSCGTLGKRPGKSGDKVKFTQTKIDGVFVVELEPIADERGFFARSFCREQFSQNNLVTDMVQGNISFNREAGTVRGLHFQRTPAAEVKLVRCTRGAIVDVAVDMRPNSPTRFQHVMVELTAENRKSLYIPQQFAHGFQTLEADCEVSYLVSEYYTPSAEGGLRYDDPKLGIVWPVPVTTVSEKDSRWPSLEPG